LQPEKPGFSEKTWFLMFEKMLNSYLSLSVFVVVMGMMIVVVPQTEAQVRFGIQGSYGDDSDFGVGGRIVFDISQLLQGCEVIGSFDYFFPDIDLEGIDYTYLEVNANIIYNVPVQNLSPYIGGGLNVARGSVSEDITGFDLGISDTEIGGNLVGGLKFQTTRLSPLTFPSYR
jgi:hypothetical protein